MVLFRSEKLNGGSVSVLFSKLKIGEIEIQNRILMAPLTRCRTDEDRVPNSLMQEYYGQRASAGLILTEATVISPMGIGYPRTPGIYSAEQVEGWSRITSKVHEHGGKIFLQLWHVGRVSDSSYLDGKLPVAPSAVAANGNVKLVRPERPYPVPRALETTEVIKIVEDYRFAAINAQKAGFDGVELHGANGYLLDQFLQDSTNLREDQYGGSLENRARLMLEVTDAAISVWGSGRVGMHLAPRCDSQSMGDSNPLQTFSYLAKELKKRKLAFLCTREAYSQTPGAADRISPLLKAEFGGILIANEGFTMASAELEIEKESADAVAFGKLFIANPDLPRRFQLGADLNVPDAQTFYSDGAIGYTDYPFL